LNFKFSPVKLVYGGQALGFHAGHTVLVPRVLPGERAEVEEIRRQKGVIHARPLQVLEPSPDRLEPLCPYFGSCGGCQYQHLAYPAQVAAKAEILRETLRRLGQVKWDQPIPTHSGPEWNYRNQAQLKVGRWPDGRTALGFFEAESNRLVPIDACPILSPRLNATLALLRTEAWTSALTNTSELELLADHNDEKVMLTLTGSWGAAEREALARRCLEELAGVSTVAIRENSDLQVLGDPHLTYRLGEFAYRLSPTAFFQSSRFLLPEFVTAVTGGVSGSVAMDLYAGVGLFTLPLAKGFDQVIGVESHPQAAEDLAANARTADRQNIRAIRSTTFDFLRRCAQMDPDLVVMDPPRAGVGTETLKLIVALRPKHLRYVSCSPPTLARDLQFLLKHGYSLDSLEMFDFFPQTYHIESLAHLNQSG
jgi:23S rRNA (uracil1939-C5)-methyltransferase